MLYPESGVDQVFTPNFYFHVDGSLPEVWDGISVPVLGGEHNANYFLYSSMTIGIWNSSCNTDFGVSVRHCDPKSHIDVITGCKTE